MIRVWVDCSDGSTIEVISGGLDDEAHPIGADGTQIAENLWVKHTLTAALVALQLHSWPYSCIPYGQSLLQL